MTGDVGFIAMLVGLVAITACGNVIPSYMAIVIGVVCVDFYEVRKFQI